MLKKYETDEKQKLSKHLQDAYNNLNTDDWFEYSDVLYSFSRREWICRRLVANGYLRERTEFVNPNFADDNDYRMITHYQKIITP